MKQRSVGAVIIYSIITFGIYALYWFVQSKVEMNNCGANIPTAWLIIIPIVNIYWLWKFSQGVQHVSNNELSAPLAFILLWVLSIIGIAIVQVEFNKVATA